MFITEETDPHDSPLVTPEVLDLFEVAHIELAAKNEENVRRWQLEKSDRWSVDFSRGTFSFHFGRRTITSPVEVIGSYSVAGSSWLWGWANGSLPEGVVGASRRVHEFGHANDIEALIEPELEIDHPHLADDFGGLGVMLAGLSGMYRSPQSNGDFVTLGYAEFTEE